MQKKLTITICSLVFVILSLNVLFSHINALTVHRQNLSQQIDTIANQLTITLELLEEKNNTVELELARSLYGSAKAAESLLPHDYANITNEMLDELSHKLNIDTITLWIRDSHNELLSINSSNPAEISLRAKTWGYWNTAMQEVFNLQPVSIDNGNIFENFYSGPLNFAVTDPSKIIKFGYYYSGNTNYMINTMVSTDKLYDKGFLEDQKAIVDRLLYHIDGLVEITAFSPTYFGQEKILKMKNGKLVQNLDVRDIIYGEYYYENYEYDVQAVKEVMRAKHNITENFTFNSLSYSRVFIPILSNEPYVISFVFNNKIMLKETYEQLFDHITISVLLFIATIIITNLICRQIVAPLLKIKEKVKHISNHNFSFPLKIKNKDELGVLAIHVNEMGLRLDTYTTELKLAANQLAQTEHQLKSIIALTNDPIAMINLNYEFYHINSAFTDLFGYRLEQIEGTALYELNPSQADAIQEKLLHIVANGFIDKCEFEFLTSSGDKKHISLSLSPILDMNEKCIGLAGIMHDMTAHHDKKQLLLQNEKLSTISQLSATIAHEFRNPLTTLHGFLKLSQQRGHLSADYIPTLLNELEHMELILGQFLTMAKPQSYMINKLNIEHLLKDIIHLLQSSGKLDHVKISWSIEPEPHIILGDNKYIRQAFVNIIINSIEAMDDGGEISISIFSMHNHVTIQVTDTGKGISPQDLERIFEPFFTNKEFGTGLGLLVTHQIIASHQGKLNYKSELNVGTSVTIELPKNLQILK